MNYIDLGLPSKILWADTNEDGYFTFDEAKEKFGDNLPSIDMWRELTYNCKWEWDKEKKGYTVTGPNGNSIFLPFTGYRYDTSPCDVGSYGYYWSSSPSPSGVDVWNYAWRVFFYSSNVVGGYENCRYGFSVRLIKNQLQ